MNKKTIKELINGNREIEFTYRGNRYSITYYNDNREKYISFCLFDHEPVDVSSAEEALKLKIGEITLGKIFESLPDSAFDIY